MASTSSATSSFVTASGASRQKGATYDRESGRAQAVGTVTYQDPDVTVYGEDAEVDTDIEEISFVNAGFDIPRRPARGSADAIRITTDDVLELQGMRFTTCPIEQTDWELLAQSVAFDVDAGFGTARVTSSSSSKAFQFFMRPT